MPTQAEQATRRRDAQRALQQQRARSKRGAAQPAAGGADPSPTPPAAAGSGADPAARPLMPEQIEYLVFEGGGGKGFAFLGALEVLEQQGKGLLRSPLWSRPNRRPDGRMKGVAGASAGAITALLVALGFTSQEIRAFIAKTDFNLFFDPPEPRMFPAPGRDYEHYFISDRDRSRISMLRAAPDHVQLLLGLGVAGLQLACPPLAFLTPFMHGYLRQKVAQVETLVDTHRREEPGRRIIPYLPEYLTFAQNDMGLFSGEYARNFFNETILKRIHDVTGQSARGFVTFEELYHRYGFRVKLLVTASNLRTAQTVPFSHTDTPNFPVADAIRISMGLPFIYKPYRIEDRYKGVPCGLYVDGGVFNNLPFREFDGEPPTPRESASLAAPAQPADYRRTLGLRLAVEPPAEIESFTDLLANAVKLGIFGTGESQVLSKYVKQTIVLDTDGLDLLAFQPPEAMQILVAKRARRQTREYFGIPADPTDEDSADDAALIARKARARRCFKALRTGDGLVWSGRE